MLQEERIFSETLRNQEIAFGDSLLSAGGILFLATLLFARPRIWFGFCFIIRAEGLSHMQHSQSVKLWWKVSKGEKGEKRLVMRIPAKLREREENSG